MVKVPKPDIKKKLQNLKGKIPALIKKFKDNYPEIKRRATGTEGIVYGAILFTLLFVVVIIVQSCTPRKGDILYAMCNEFLTLHIPFPTTLQKTEVEFYRRARRIYYTHIDAYGTFQMEMIECSFYQDPDKGVQLDRVFFNYIKDITETTRSPGKGRLYEVKKEFIDLFNISRSPAAIVNSDPDLIIPDRLDQGEKIPPYPDFK